MKYAMLVYIDPPLMQALSPAEGQQLTDAAIDYDRGLAARGQLVMGQALQGVETAITVRVRNGRMSSTDGPFAETKELLAGFTLIEARDLNEAVEIAAAAPMARMGSIEVRPFLHLSHS